MCESVACGTTERLPLCMAHFVRRLFTNNAASHDNVCLHSSVPDITSYQPCAIIGKVHNKCKPENFVVQKGHMDLCCATIGCHRLQNNTKTQSSLTESLSSRHTV